MHVFQPAGFARGDARERRTTGAHRRLSEHTCGCARIPTSKSQCLGDADDCHRHCRSRDRRGKRPRTRCNLVQDRLRGSRRCSRERAPRRTGVPSHNHRRQRPHRRSRSHRRTQTLCAHSASLMHARQVRGATSRANGAASTRRSDVFARIDATTTSPTASPAGHQRLALSAGIASERPTPKSSPSDRSRLFSTSSSASTKLSACCWLVMSGGRILRTF